MPLFGERDQATWQQLLNKSWEELGVAEQNGELYFPETVLKRRKDGSIESIPVSVRVPREPDFRRARVAARKWAQSEDLDPRTDADLVDNLETLCTLTLCIRNATPPYEQWVVAGEKGDLIGAAQLLESKYDKKSLEHLWSKLDAYARALDPRPDQFTETQLLAVITAIAKRRDIAPLHAFGGESQIGLVVAMASRLATLLELNLSSEPSDSLTPES